MTTPALSHPGQCVHEWHQWPALAMGSEESYREECSRCGSRCSRDKDGKIVSYVRNFGGAPVVRTMEAPHAA